MLKSKRAFSHIARIRVNRHHDGLSICALVKFVEAVKKMASISFRSQRQTRSRLSKLPSRTKKISKSGASCSLSQLRVMMSFAACRSLSLSSSKKKSKSALMRCKKFNRARARSYLKDELSKRVLRTCTVACSLTNRINKKRVRIRMPLRCSVKWMTRQLGI